ncbi:hypothetical protein [Poseidonocella sedimentorum]|uniref:hypothetical protein n=1 Tax=Poseidonocella sedimentorum TaxID=871652 RepID=UPI0015A65FAA|nr:hypothetical protein [Poseidonocella sedimentorum]
MPQPQAAPAMSKPGARRLAILPWRQRPYLPGVLARFADFSNRKNRSGPLTKEAEYFQTPDEIPGLAVQPFALFQYENPPPVPIDRQSLMAFFLSKLVTWSSLT